MAGEDGEQANRRAGMCRESHSSLRGEQLEREGPYEYGVLRSIRLHCWVSLRDGQTSGRERQGRPGRQGTRSTLQWEHHNAGLLGTYISQWSPSTISRTLQGGA